MSLVALTLAMSLAGSFQAERVQAPVLPPQVRGRDAASQVDDVIVEGGRLRGLSVQDQATAFVGEVAAPASRRGLARWNGRVCVGVINVRNDVAHALADHVSRMAVDVGLTPGDPGCSPNVVIIFTNDAKEIASALVARKRQAFRLGVDGLDRGNHALRAFQTSDDPVRWWHVSMPIVGATGERAIRMPGDQQPIYVPGEGRVNAGRPIADAITKAIVIIDINKVEATPLPQLADYIGLVSLSQVDPEGDTRAFETILNLFDNPDASPGLSSWDRSYLASLYQAYPERINPWDQAGAMARGIIRASRTEARETVPQP